MTKFGYDSLNFAKMFTLPIKAKRRKLCIFTNACLQSNLKSLNNVSKLPICDIISSLLCLMHVFFAIFKDRVHKLVSGSRMFIVSITNSIAIGQFTPLCE